MRKLLSVSLILIFSVLESSSGQIFPSENYGLLKSSYDILPMGEGVFAINVDRVTRKIHYFFTNEDLDRKNEGTYSYNEFLYNIKYKIKEEKVYVLFHWNEVLNYQKVLMIINADTGEVDFLPVHNSLITYVSDFFILENTIAMIGFNQVDKSLVQFMDLYDHTQEMSSIYLQVKILDVAESDGYLDIIAIRYLNNGVGKLELITLNEEGQKLYNIEAETLFDNNGIILSAILQKNDEGTFRTIGTYSLNRKSKFSGYFCWELDHTLDQQFTMYPVSSLQGFTKGNSKIVNRQIRSEMTKGFCIAKVLENNGQLAIISIPGNEYHQWKRHPRVFDNSMIHVLYINENEDRLWDEMFSYNRAIKSSFMDFSFLNNPPFYLVKGSIYFLYNEGFAHNPNLKIHNFRSHEVMAARDLCPNLPITSNYRIQQLKNNEIIVYGFRENIFKERSFFMNKIPMTPEVGK